MKKILILFIMLMAFNSFAIVEFSSSETVKASEFNYNFGYIKNILQNDKNTNINFILFNSGDVINKDVLNQEFSKIAALGIDIPLIQNEYISADELNDIFFLIISGVVAYDDIPVLYNMSLNTQEDIFVEQNILYQNNVGTLSYSLVSNPASGIVNFIGQKIVYTPNLNFSGTDSFSFRAFDGKHYSNIINQNVVVSAINDAPVANSKSIQINEDEAINIVLEATDVDNSNLSYILVQAPQNGTLSGNFPNLIYTPNLNFSGTDSFSFKVNDGNLDSNTATISLTINPVNDIPVISGSDISLNQNSSVLGSISVLDVDSSTFSYSLVTPPSKGNFLWGANGSYTYTASLNTYGNDSFVVRVSDGINFSDNLTINVLINASGIILTSNVRTYFDGSSAESCREYRYQNNGNYTYTGSSLGNGYYSIKPDSGAAFTVYCDMTTDNGGWTLVLRQHDGTMALATTAAVNSGSVHLRNVNAKYTDAMIRTIARSGSLEALVEYNTSNKYILRYSDAEWSSYSSIGWTNTQYDSKNSSGSWVNNTCNGHVNNRGFSTWSDTSGATCPTIYQGSRFYFTPYHTAGWSNVTNKSPTNVFVR